MECAVPVGQMHLEYPTRSSKMLEDVQDGSIMFEDIFKKVFQMTFPIGEMYIEYPTSSSIMFEIIQDSLIVFKYV